MSLKVETEMEILRALGIEERTPGGFSGEWVGSGKVQKVVSPVNGETLATVINVTKQEFEGILAKSHAAFASWKLVPAAEARRGREGAGRRAAPRTRRPCAELVTLEMGKTLREGLGEVQEMIDVCDLAVGLSRQLYGLTMPSERRQHRLQEQWHPLGVVGVITAFNFPVAVWSWNTALALVCGDTVLWKPSSKTPLTALAVTKIARRVLERFGYDPAICCSRHRPRAATSATSSTPTRASPSSPTRARSPAGATSASSSRSGSASSSSSSAATTPPS